MRETGIDGAGEAAIILEGARELGVGEADRGGNGGLERTVGVGDGPERCTGEVAPSSTGDDTGFDRTVGAGDGPERGGGEPCCVPSSTLVALL